MRISALPPLFVCFALSFTSDISEVRAEEILKQWKVADGGNDHWYSGVVVAPGYTWSEANTIANSRGGYLASVTSAAEDAWLITNLVGPMDLISDEIGAPWLGGFQDTSAGDYSEPNGGWRWVSGEPWGYTGWGGPEPTNGVAGEDYLAYWLYSTPWWNDVPDNADRFDFIIEFDIYPFAGPNNPGPDMPNRGPRRNTPKAVIRTNFGAIVSTMTSGLGVGIVNQQIILNAADVVLKDLQNPSQRGRSAVVDKSRSGRYRDGSSLRSRGNSDSSLLNYLAFVQGENMSYKVALGLADGDVRNVEVNLVDTLSSQAGTILNGQSLGGGLPYAMMGVPLMPVAGGVATVQIVEAAPSSKTVIDDSKAVIENEPWKRWELFTSGDFSFYDQDQLTDMMQGFDTDTYAGSVGIESRALSWLNLGLVWSYLESDTNISGNYGNIDLEGNLVSGYATAFWRQYWADLLYSYGSFNSDLHRNTGLGSKTTGDTDSQSHNIRLTFGRSIQLGKNIITGPIAGLRYSNGDVDPYSETGGGTAALNYDGTDFESMVSRVGWQASHGRHTGWGRIITQIHMAWEHEYMPENGTVAASLQTSPFALVTGGSARSIGGFSTESDGAHPGTDWVSAGAGLRFETDNGWSVATNYEGAFFRSNASQHYASVKVGYEW